VPTNKNPDIATKYPENLISVQMRSILLLLEKNFVVLKVVRVFKLVLESFQNGLNKGVCIEKKLSKEM